MNKRNKSKKGFTLVEVFLTLIVIGVVISLTIPMIIQNTQNARFKASFKSNYSTLAAATQRLVQENAGSLVGLFVDPDGAGTLTIDDDCRDKYLQYMSYVIKCNDYDVKWISGQRSSNCWSADNYALNEELGTTSWAEDSQVMLNNGALLDFRIYDTNCQSDVSLNSDGSYPVCGTIIMDVNGLKPPNQYGRDLFVAYIKKNGLAPFGTSNDSSYEDCDPNSWDLAGFGRGCASKVLLNQDY